MIDEYLCESFSNPATINLGRISQIVQDFIEKKTD